jgi:pimeloyl-ACP methyl ester carboxylesterase
MVSVPQQYANEASMSNLQGAVHSSIGSLSQGPIRRGLARLAAGSLAFVLVVSATGGCTREGQESTPVSAASYASAACPTPNVPGEAEGDLGPEFSCGYLTVPENRAKPNGRTIKIAVARLRARAANPKPDPVVWLSGGPGVSGLIDAVGFSTLRPAINADRDVIFVAQRGTLHADPVLSCPEVDTFIVEALGLVLTDESTARRRTEAVRACHSRLAGLDYDLSAYNTTENAADIADLRVALGINEWNVYAWSYGTDLALQLIREHPQGIRSLMLDGVVPPHLNLPEGFWPNAAAGYKALFEACAAQPACNAANPNLSAGFTATVQRLDRAPLTVSVPGQAGAPATTVVLDGYQVASLPVTLASVPGALTGAPAVLHALAAGDGLPAATALLAASQGLPGLTGWGLFWGVFCREQVASTERQTVQAMAKAALPDFPDRVLGLLPQQGFLSRLFDDCAVWDVGRADTRVSAQARSDVPTLLLSGTLDGITPPGWAAAAATGLPNSRSLLFPGLGHYVFPSSECARTAVTGFLDQPSGGHAATCVSELTVPPFSVG